MNQTNPSTAQARAIVDELHRHGVTFSLISPGSRSAALAIALEEHPGIRTKVVLDERSAAFQAIGYARASGWPAVCVCTSGTALANFLPAIVEADEGLVPFIALTADRPPELRDVASNQTIRQVGIFEQRVRWFCDLGVADLSFDGNSYWRTTVAQAVARATGFGGRPGPVHVNVGFREPTVPVLDDGRSTSEPYPHSIQGRDGGRPWQAVTTTPPRGAEVEALATGRGVVIVGDGVTDPDGLVREASRLGWPILATALSGVRGPGRVSTYHHLLVGGVPPGLEPEVVLSVGRVGPSDHLWRLQESSPLHVQIDVFGRWSDPRRSAGMMIQADPVETLALVPDSAAPGWVDGWLAAEREVRQSLDDSLGDSHDLTGPAVARMVSDLAWDLLSVASSMPIRDVDAHMTRSGKVIANRGASGIDGFISTTLGAIETGRKVLGIGGDLSFLHDLTALAQEANGPGVLAVIDNNGGGLFDLLPQAAHAPSFDRLFIAPHGLDLGPIFTALGVRWASPTTLEEVREEMGAGLDSDGLHVVLIRVDRETELKQRKELERVAQAALSALR